MGDAGVIDEAFFRRYRELLDAEDCAFDELEHAYEDGDRAHFADDYASWKHSAEKRAAVAAYLRPPALHPCRQRLLRYRLAPIQSVLLRDWR